MLAAKKADVRPPGSITLDCALLQNQATLTVNSETLSNRDAVSMVSFAEAVFDICCPDGDHPVIGVQKGGMVDLASTGHVLRLHGAVEGVLLGTLAAIDDRLTLKTLLAACKHSIVARAAFSDAARHYSANARVQFYGKRGAAHTTSQAAAYTAALWRCRHAIRSV